MKYNDFPLEDKTAMSVWGSLLLAFGWLKSFSLCVTKANRPPDEALAPYLRANVLSFESSKSSRTKGSYSPFRQSLALAGKPLADAMASIPQCVNFSQEEPFLRLGDRFWRLDVH